MRQYKLGKQVDTVMHRAAGLSTPLYWNKDTCAFGVFLANEAYQNKDAEAVKKYASDAMKVMGTLSWTPVILIMDLVEPGSYHYSNKRLEQHEISFHFDRFYAADMPDGSVRAIEWDVPEAKRTTSFTNVYCWTDGKKTTDLPYKSENGQYFFFPYTEELWTGVKGLADGIDQLRKKFRQLLHKDDVQQIIAGAGARMLTMLTDAPSVPDEPKEEE